MSVVDDAGAKMIENLAKNTGKTLEEWIAIVKPQKLEKHGAILKWLKAEHGFTHGFANLVAHKTLASDAGSQDDDDLIKNQYAKKQNLKPIYDLLKREISKFGNDIEFAPKKAYVSVRRKKQFALIQPSTAKRLDIGIKSKKLEAQGALELAGSWNAMVSHRVRITDISEVDASVIQWLKEAYDEAV